MERRAFITAGAVVPFAGFAIAEPADPLVEYLKNWKAARADWKAAAKDQSADWDDSQITQREYYWGELICTTRAVSPAGLAAQLEYAAIDLEQYWVGNLTDNLDGQLLKNMKDFLAAF